MEGREEGRREVKMSDLTPEEREEVIRLYEEHNLPEPGDDVEIQYYLFPFPEDREVTDEANDKACKPGDEHNVSDSEKT